MSRRLSTKSDDSGSTINLLGKLFKITILLHAVYFFGMSAYRIRLLAIEEYGPVIHEFDPYFNYRATEYLYRNGWKKFVRWFDYKVWYPLGRPVGTTIYPGMQVTAVFLKTYIIGDKMSVNDICCYMPAWFGVFASLFTGFLAYECSLPQSSSETLFSAVVGIFRQNKKQATAPVTSYKPAAEVGVVAMGIMAILPAHLMRSVGGGYDNECVAVSAMTLTFWLWCRSLRTDDSKSYVFGALAGVAYFYMAAAWGGYVFVLNLVGAHALLLVSMNRFSTKLYRSYSLFYLVGTSLSIRVPVVGLTPLKSLEQLGPGVVFLFYQALQLCEYLRLRKNLNRSQSWRLRFKVFTIALLLAIAVIYLVAPTGYFGPISARVRGLFVKHTRTGNPLVDSVAEHQPASKRAYFQYLHYLLHIAPIGFLLVLFNFGDAPSFLLLYGTIAYFFSAKMVRLILLLAPIASALGGVVIGRWISWSFDQLLPWIVGDEKKVVKQVSVEDTSSEKKKEPIKNKKKREIADATAYEPSSFDGLVAMKDAFIVLINSSGGRTCKRILALISIFMLLFMSRIFRDYSWHMASMLSNPSIITKARTQSGELVTVDDYREAYFWLRDNTPKDARILAWWDYGYQITGISNRTTLADGNTWNHEHIALLGRILTGPEDEGHEMARHLADYALVWAGGGGDDLAKSPHLARIANSVFRNMCPGDPTCRSFGFMDKFGTPSPMMGKSFLFKLHSHKIKPGVEADPKKFREVYRTQYGKVRIFKILGVSKESKKWIADRRNRKCDVPGSWFCPGQYPPALDKFLREKKDFAQLEDFNRKTVDEEYQKQYFENMEDPKKAREKARIQNHKIMQEKRKENTASSAAVVEEEEDDESEHMKPISLREMKSRFDKFKSSETSEDLIDEIYSTYSDTEETTLMWKIVTSNAVQDLMNWLAHDPIMAYTRSGDGRGPMWWAYESQNMEIVDIFKKLGISDRDRDKYGKRPIDLLRKPIP